MYEIRAIVNEEERGLDLLSPSFPYTFEGASIADLKDQAANWSYTITLPRSRNNDEILGGAGLPFVVTDKPYKRLECNVYADGVRIIRGGLLYIDTTTAKEYRVQIVSGVADVFERLGDIALEDLGGAEITLPFNTIPTPAKDNGTSPVIYPTNLVLSEDKPLGNAITNFSQAGGIFQYATPLVKVGGPTQGNGLLKKVLDRVGYTLETDTSATEMSYLYISPEEMKASQEEKDAVWQSEAKTLRDNNLEAVVIPFTNTNYTIKARVMVQPRANYYKNSRGQYMTAPQVLGAMLTACPDAYLQVQISDATSQTSHIYVTRNTPLRNFASAGQYEEEFEIPDEVLGKSLWLTAYLYDPTTGLTYWTWTYYDGSGSVEYTGMEKTGRFMYKAYSPQDGDKAWPGDKMNAYGSLGIKTGLDLFRLLSQIFGWVVNVGRTSIQAHTFAYIKNRKSQALDWTEKMAMNEESETAYQFGEYAQVNRITFQDNERTGYKDVAEFTIPSQNLERECTLLEFGSTSGQGWQIEAWDYVEEEGWKRSMNGSHIMRYDGREPYEAGAIARHLSAQDVRNNYNALAATLQQAQVLRARFILTALDIRDLNPYTPVFLRQTGAYYYVNKISEWEEGRSASVELLRL